MMAASIAISAALSALGCAIEFGIPPHGAPWPSPSDPCYAVDLSALPAGPFSINDTYPELYTITSPCHNISDCGSPAVQNRPQVTGCSVGIPLGELSQNQTAPLVSASGDVIGINLTLRDGNSAIGCSTGRSFVYNLMCDETVPVSNPPESPITYGNDRCTYVVSWKSPAACPKKSSGSCGAMPNLTLPTANQLRYQQSEIVALTHFNMASFIQNGDPGCTDSNWLVKAPGAVGPSSDPGSFNPIKLNTSQWAEVYQKTGVKGAVLTAKHGCGHLLWPTNVTLPDGSPYSYGVGKSKSAIKDDVLKMFSESMQAAGITHGFYYSLTNNYFLNVQGHQAHHKPTVLPGQVNVNQSEFENIALGHVAELWSNYGQLGEIWFDGGYTGDMATGIEALIKQQKLAVGFGGSGVMSSPVGWIGTESGMPGFPHIWSTGGNGAGDPTSQQWMPKCCDTTLQNGDVWFFEPGQSIRDLGTLIDIYHQTVGRNGVLELDFAINRDGLVDPVHEERYTQFGDWIRGCYESPVSAANFTGQGIVLTPSRPTTIDRTMLQEDQSQGQRVRGYTIDAMVDGEWKLIVQGTGIGNKQIDILSSQITVSALRVNITSAMAIPIVRFAMFAPCPSA